MLINDLSDEELLTLAQQTRSLDRTQYDYSESSILNYVRMVKFRSTMKTEKIYRVPFSLMYMHYVDWMKENQPKLLVQSYSMFLDEVPQFFNYIRTPHHGNCALLINHLMFRKYNHTYNENVYHPYVRAKWSRAKRKEYGRKKKTKKKYKVY
jgi:hypothetical protein